MWRATSSVQKNWKEQENPRIPRDFNNENDRIRVRVIDGEAFVVE
jgi:hypothetical protein